MAVSCKVKLAPGVSNRAFYASGGLGAWSRLPTRSGQEGPHWGPSRARPARGANVLPLATPPP